MTLSSISNATFDDFMDQEGICVLVFTADWCKPCLDFYPILNQLTADYPEINFATVDVEKEKDLSADFHIRSVPTVMLFRERVALCMETGAMSKSTLDDLIGQARALNMKEVHQNIAQQMIDE